MNEQGAIREKNKAILQRLWPRVYEAWKTTVIHEKRCLVWPSKSGDPYLEIKGHNGGNILFHSRYNPKAEAEHWAESIEEAKKKAAFVFFYGFGLGYHLEAWLRRHPDRYVFVYEPDIEVFDTALRTRDLTPVLSDPRLIGLAIGDDDNVVRELALSLVRTLYRTFEWIVHPVYERHFSGRVRPFIQMMIRITEQTISNIATFLKFGEHWPFLIINNLRYVCKSPSILAAKDYYRGIPALIVGSGPSLDIDLPQLERLTERCLIIAAGSSIQPLMKAGIKPHMVVSVDPGMPNYYVFQNLNLREVPLIFAPTIYYKILEKEETQKIWFRVNVDYFTDFLLPPEPEEPSFISTASVTGVCIQLAAYFGCHPILLVGQDLSYPDRSVYASHVDHATEEGKERILQAIDRQVENVSGGVNPTTLTMLNILRSIEEIIEFHPHIRFINVSRIGARIRGTEWMPLDRWEEEDLRLRPDAPPIVPLMSVVDASEPVRRLPKALERLREAKSGLVDIAGRLERINGLLERLKRAEETRSALKAATLALRLEGEWNELLKNTVYCAFYSLPTTLVVDAFLRARPVIAAERDPIARARMLLQYFEPVVRKSEEMTPKLVRNVQALLNYFGD